MKDGFVKCAVASASVRVADTMYNTASIISLMRSAVQQGVRLLVLPELVTTAYTCADLFLQKSLQKGAVDAIANVVDESRNSDLLVVFGSLIPLHGRLYNCAVVVQSGRILGLVPKQHLPNYLEYYEKRWFKVPTDGNIAVEFLGQSTYFGTRLLFTCTNLPELVVACEICEDLWVPRSPSTDHAVAGATVITNCSASDEFVGKEEYRRSLVKTQSGRLICAYLYSDAGEGESTTDLVFSPHNLIFEDGHSLGEQREQSDTLLITEIDVQKLALERIRRQSFGYDDNMYQRIPFTLEERECTLTRKIDRNPFVPSDAQTMTARCEKILTLQSLGLKKRLEHTKVKQVIVGLSGGLDSTLALLVCVRAFDALKLPRSGICLLYTSPSPRD